MKPVLSYLQAIFYDPKSGKPSLGRTAFWAAFLRALFSYPALSETWLILLLSFAGYNQVSKLIAGKDQQSCTIGADAVSSAEQQSSDTP